jgi:hypothetical protein
MLPGAPYRGKKRCVAGLYGSGGRVGRKIAPKTRVEFSHRRISAETTETLNFSFINNGDTSAR